MTDNGENTFDADDGDFWDIRLIVAGFVMILVGTACVCFFRKRGNRSDSSVEDEIGDDTDTPPSECSPNDSKKGTRDLKSVHAVTPRKKAGVVLPVKAGTASSLPDISATILQHFWHNTKKKRRKIHRLDPENFDEYLEMQRRRQMMSLGYSMDEAGDKTTEREAVAAGSIALARKHPKTNSKTS